MLRLIFLFFLSLTICAQKQHIDNPEVVSKSSKITAVNSLGEFYELSNETLLKGPNRYHNTLLGRISQVDASNPLKIWVFYGDFQTAIQLDNMLTPIQKIQFTDAHISFVGEASEDRLWRINSDTNQLELYLIRSQKSIPLFTPFSERVIGFSSSQEFCWVQTPSSLLMFNVYGSLIKQVDFDGEGILDFDGKTLVVKNNDGWHALSFKKDNELQLLAIEKYLPQRVFPSGKYFYIYDGNQLIKTKLPN